MAHPDYPQYRGSFDPIYDTIASITDPRDPTQVAEVKNTVEAMLESRPREEVDGEGALRVDYAYERISGSIADLRMLRRRAVQAAAQPDLLALIDTVIAEAEAARDTAPRRQVRTALDSPRAADWATAELEPDRTHLPEFLQDI